MSAGQFSSVQFVLWLRLEKTDGQRGFCRDFFEKEREALKKFLPALKEECVCVQEIYKKGVAAFYYFILILAVWVAFASLLPNCIHLASEKREQGKAGAAQLELGWMNNHYFDLFSHS